MSRSIVLCVLVLLCTDLICAAAPPPALSASVAGQSRALLRISLRDASGEAVAVANGFFIDARGIVVTASHLVVQWRDTPQHTLALVTEQGRELSAEEVIFLDERRGVAVLKVRGGDFPAVPFARTHRTRKGDAVVSFDRREGAPALPVQGLVEEMTEGDGFFRMATSLSALNEGSPVFSAKGLLAGVAVVTGAVEKGRSVTIAAPAGSFSDAVGAWREVQHGYGHAESGKHKEALAAFRRAVRLRPDYAEAQYALGVALSSMELFGEAQDAYAAAVKLMPHHLSARLYLGKTYTLLGKHDEAVETYLQLLALAPDYAEAYVLLGYSYQEKEMNHSAIQAYEEAIRIAPDFVDAYLMLGGLYVKSGNYREALNTWKRALHVRPEHAETRLRLGVLYLAMGDADGAMAEYRALSELDSEKAELLRAQIGSWER